MVVVSVVVVVVVVSSTAGLASVAGAVADFSVVVVVSTDLLEAIIESHCQHKPF